MLVVVWISSVSPGRMRWNHSKPSSIKLIQSARSSNKHTSESFVDAWPSRRPWNHHIRKLSSAFVQSTYSDWLLRIRNDWLRGLWRTISLSRERNRQRIHSRLFVCLRLARIADFIEASEGSLANSLMLLLWGRYDLKFTAMERISKRLSQRLMKYYTTTNMELSFGFDSYWWTNLFGLHSCVLGLGRERDILFPDVSIAFHQTVLYGSHAWPVPGPFKSVVPQHMAGCWALCHGPFLMVHLSNWSLIFRN